MAKLPEINKAGDATHMLIFPLVWAHYSREGAKVELL